MKRKSSSRRTRWNLSLEIKAGILQRRDEADAHPERLEPWEGTTERVRTRLHELRLQKTQGSLSLHFSSGSVVRGLRIWPSKSGLAPSRTSSGYFSPP